MKSIKEMFHMKKGGAFSILARDDSKAICKAHGFGKRGRSPFAFPPYCAAMDEN
jgi:hypothetical protein